MCGVVSCLVFILGGTVLSCVSSVNCSQILHCQKRRDLDSLGWIVRTTFNWKFSEFHRHECSSQGKAHCSSWGSCLPRRHARASWHAMQCFKSCSLQLFCTRLVQGKLHGLYHFCLQLMIVHGCCYLQGLVEAESCPDWEATFNMISLATLAVLQHSCRSSLYLSLFHSAAPSIVTYLCQRAQWAPEENGDLCLPPNDQVWLAVFASKEGGEAVGMARGPLWLVNESWCGVSILIHNYFKKTAPWHLL